MVECCDGNDSAWAWAGYVLTFFDPAGESRARSHCRFVLPLVRFIPDSLTYSVPLFLKRQCDRTLGESSCPAVVDCLTARGYRGPALRCVAGWGGTTWTKRGGEGLSVDGSKVSCESALHAVLALGAGEMAV